MSKQEQFEQWITQRWEGEWPSLSEEAWDAAWEAFCECDEHFDEQELRDCGLLSREWELQLQLA